MSTLDQVSTGAWVALAWITAPALAVAFAVGLAVSLMQALTSIQESSLSFAPKFGALIVLFAIGGAVMFHGLTDYAAALYHSLPQLIAYG